MTTKFGSDNQAGAHPDVLAAIAAANDGHAPSYGADPWTARAQELFQRHFGPGARAFLTTTGSAANVLAVAAACKPWESVIASDAAHLLVDECGAPQQFTGVSIHPVPREDGRLRPEDLAPWLGNLGDVHRVQPKLLSITNSTEWGTVYEPDAIRALADAAHVRGLLLHLDGARLCNAAAALDVPLRTLTTDAGVDLVSFGGTKNGAVMAEALVVLRDDVGVDLPFLQKRSLQLVSKMRFLSAQYVALLEGDLWLRNARHANAMARRLADALAPLPGITLARDVEANAVFLNLPAAVVDTLGPAWGFGFWDRDASLARLMCAFDTPPDAVDRFAQEVAGALAGLPARS